MRHSDSWSRLRRALLIGFLVLLMGASGLLVLGSVTHDTGVAGFLIGLSLALLPLPVVIGALRWLDRYEPEPRGVLLFAFFWGATVAALVAAVLNTASLIAIARTGGGSGMDTTAVLVAPWVEEAAKGAAVLLVLLFRRNEFDGVVDGIVLAGLSAVGLRLHREHPLLRPGLPGRPGAGPDRAGSSPPGSPSCCAACFSPFAHPLFTAMTGIGLGIAAADAEPGDPAARPAGRLPARRRCCTAPGTCRRCPGCPASSPATS